MWNMFKVNNEDTRIQVNDKVKNEDTVDAVHGVFIVNSGHISLLVTVLSIVDFDLLSASWSCLLLRRFVLAGINLVEVTDYGETR